MKTSSAKNKGRRLQNLVVEIVREMFGFGERDVRSTPSGVNGPDVQLSEVAFKMFPFAIECKNHERLNVWAAMDQAESNRKYGIPMLVFSRNRSPVYCVIGFRDLIELCYGIAKTNNGGNDAKVS